jgi:hypothetical protein
VEPVTNGLRTGFFHFQEPLSALPYPAGRAPEVTVAAPRKRSGILTRSDSRYQEITVIVQVVVPESPAVSTTWIVKVYVPFDTVGDPLITPVEGFSVKPGGNEPETIE